MIATLRQNALPIAMILVCAAALYLVYRDMKKFEVRLNRLDAAVIVLAEGQTDACMIHEEPPAEDRPQLSFEEELEAELDADDDADAEADAEPEAEPEADAEPEPEPEPVAEAVEPAAEA